MAEPESRASVIRVLIADDHPAMREGLHSILGPDPQIAVVGVAATGDEAVVLAERLRPDVVLMDLQMPGLDGASAIARLAEGGNAARVLVLTVSHTDSDIRTAVGAGAAGYLLKESPAEDLVRAVHAAALGEAVLSPSVATRLLVQVRTPAEEPLSQREVQVLELVAGGLTNRQLSRRLAIAEPTVKTHLAHIFGKLGVRDRAAAVAAGYDRGILKPSPPRLAC